MARVLRALRCGRISNPRWCKRDERLLLFEKLNNTKVMATQASQNNTFGWREGKQNGAKEALRSGRSKGMWTAGNPMCVSGLKQNLNARREGRRVAGAKPGFILRSRDSTLSSAEMEDCA